MKRRLMIARALMHEPRLLILDEPTAGVDIEIRRSMWEFLREINEQGTTIILTTHYLEEAENLCRNVAIIDGGRIIERDSMANVLRKLQTETFVFNLREPLPTPPQLAGFRRADRRAHAGGGGVKGAGPERHLRAPGGAGHRGISMRNKVNRLEELFMRLVDDSGRRGRNASSTPWCTRHAFTHGLDRISDDRPPRVLPHRTHLGPDPPAAGGHRDAVFRDLRQPDRPAHGADGRLRLHAVHRPRA